MEKLVMRRAAGLIGIVLLVAMPSVTLAGGSSTITFADGTRVSVLTNMTGSTLTYYDKAGAKIRSEKSPMSGTGGHKALMKKLEKPGSKVGH
jgi:hypothetical protein